MAKAAHFEESPKSRARSRALKVTGIVSGSILGLILVAYIAGCFYFDQRLWPNTFANGIDLSMMSRAEAEEALNEASSTRGIQVVGAGVDFKLDSDTTGLRYNTRDAVGTILDSSSVFEWPIRILQSHDASEVLATSYDRDAIAASVSTALAAYNETALDPIDAHIAFDEGTLRYYVDEGSDGTKLDTDKVVDAVVTAIQNESGVASLDESCYVPRKIAADDPGLQQAVSLANTYLACNLTLTLAGNTMETLNASTVRNWVSIDEFNVVHLDDAQLTSWVDGLERRIDNIGSTRTYTRPDGAVITVTGGSYGWNTNGNAIDELLRNYVTNGLTGTEEIPCWQRAVNYNPGGQDWGSRYVDVDVYAQHVTFYDGGTIIWQSDCVTGSPLANHSTPNGVYVLNSKELNSILRGEIDPATNKPSYETPVAFWMPFIDNAVGLHDATWQAAFGGSRYVQGYGSHGCVNLPYDAAQSLFYLINVGDVVVVHGS